MTHYFPKKLVCQAISAIALGLACGAASAATVLETDFKELTALAQKDGFAPVQVLLVRSSFSELATGIPKLKSDTQTKAAALLKALGAEALPESRDVNPLGLIDLLVTQRGLAMLKENNDAISFTPGSDWHVNVLLSNLDGSLTAINDQLKRSGTAAVEVTLNIDKAKFAFDKTIGSANLVLTEGQQQEALDKAAGILNKMGFEAIEKGSKSKSNDRIAIIDTNRIEQTGKIIMQLDRRALHSLARDRTVLAIKPVGYQDPSRYSFDATAIDVAKKSGMAEVIIQLKMPMFSGHINSETQKVHNQINQDIMNDVLSGIKLSSAKHLPLQGTLIAFLSEEELQKLARLSDARIFGVSANKPMFKPSLSTSAYSTGMATLAWPSGMTGAGQTIWVFDTGIKKNHVMLQRRDGGGSKVIYEACYQTQDQSYKSTCVNADPVTGDSAGPGTGEPMTLADCGLSTTFQTSYCSHGTHVAGIAAGRFSSTTPAIQGMAPDALLASINVTTRAIHATGVNIFEADILPAINSLGNAVPQGAIYPAVVNLSLGGEPETSETDWVMTTPYYSFAAAVAKLKSAGVPVVAAMGNENENYRINKPSTVAHVIKVGAVINDTQGKTYFGDSGGMASMLGSNRALPSKFPNGPMYFAPGALIRSAVVDYANSSNNSAIDYLSGTSMATPHVAGIYAALKSASPNSSVDNVTAWINANFSYTVPNVFTCSSLNSGCTNYNFKGIGVPRP